MSTMKRTLQNLASVAHRHATAKSSSANTASTSDSDFEEMLVPEHKARPRPASAESTSEAAKKKPKKRRMSEREASVPQTPAASGSMRISHRHTSSRPLPLNYLCNIDELASSDEEAVMIVGMPNPALMVSAGSGSERGSITATNSMSAATSASQPSTSTSISAVEGGHTGKTSRPPSSRTSTSREQGDQTNSRPQVKEETKPSTWSPPLQLKELGIIDPDAYIIADLDVIPVRRVALCEHSDVFAKQFKELTVRKNDLEVDGVNHNYQVIQTGDNSSDLVALLKHVHAELRRDQNVAVYRLLGLFEMACKYETKLVRDLVYEKLLGMLHHPERKMRLPSAIKFYAMASLALGESSLTETCDHLVKNRHSWVGQTARNKDKWVFMVKERAVEGDRFETTEVRVNMRDRAAADLFLAALQAK